MAALRLAKRWDRQTDRQTDIHTPDHCFMTAMTGKASIMIFEKLFQMQNFYLITMIILATHKNKAKCEEHHCQHEPI